MKDLLQLFEQRRSTRKFRNKAIPEDLIIRIIETGQRAPTAGELYSVIWVRDKVQKEGLPYERKNAEILIVCADFKRLHNLLKYQDEKMMEMESWLFIWGLIDTGLFMQNMIMAAEALGLGSVIMGGIAAEMKKVCDILMIPKYVIPIAGLAIGYPSENPPVRPRLNHRQVLHIDRYQEPVIEDLMANIKKIEISRQNEQYYKKYGKRSDDTDYSYLKHTILKYSTQNMKPEKINEYKQVLRDQLNINLV